VQDKFIVGKVFTGNVPVNTVLSGDAAGSANLNGWIDCTQYRSVYITITQSASVTTSKLQLEVSNDGVNTINNPIGFFDLQGVAASSTISTGSGITLSATAGTTVTRVGNVGFRYLRIRVQTAITTASTTTVQAFITLRQTPAPYFIMAGGNLSQLNGQNMAQGSTLASPNVMAGNLTFIPLGGNDKSVQRPEYIGAPMSNGIGSTQLFNGPYARLAYVDLAGGVVVAGVQPYLAEDKTYPVNVRLERSTAGQDSVQDLLQQILIELRANNYYTRETPMAVAALLQSPNLLSSATSMQDDPESFADDSTTSRYQKGH
jgi:hypothetical protein